MFQKIFDSLKIHKIISIFSLIFCISCLAFFLFSSYLFDKYYTNIDANVAMMEDHNLFMIRSARNFKIKSISSDSINYYVSYSYDVVEIKDGEEGDTATLEELLTIDKKSVKSKKELVDAILGEFKNIFVGINEETLQGVKKDVEYVIDNPNEQLNSPPEYKTGEESKEIMTPPIENNNPGVEKQPPIVSPPPILPPGKTPYYDTSGPPPIDYYPAPNDPPTGQ